MATLPSKKDKLVQFKAKKQAATLVGRPRGGSRRLPELRRLLFAGPQLNQTKISDYSPDLIGNPEPGQEEF
jgi:hypothetical protein